MVGIMEQVGESLESDWNLSSSWEEWGGEIRGGRGHRSKGGYKPKRNPSGNRRNRTWAVFWLVNYFSSRGSPSSVFWSSLRSSGGLQVCLSSWCSGESSRGERFILDQWTQRCRPCSFIVADVARRTWCGPFHFDVNWSSRESSFQV